jgi:hypothetical protein
LGLRVLKIQVFENRIQGVRGFRVTLILRIRRFESFEVSEFQGSQESRFRKFNVSSFQGF